MRIAVSRKVMSAGKGFTLIELLLVMAIIGILVATIFISVGNQRQKAKLNAVLKTARGVQAITQECHFRLGRINQPNIANEICTNSATHWFPITISECSYSNLTVTELAEFYEISCPDFDKKIQCGIQSGGKCEILDI